MLRHIKVKLIFVFLILIVLPLINADLGYELLDNNTVLHLWNTADHYYFNATSGMQFTNHYNQYWSKNVFCGGYWNGDTWVKHVCIDELPFTWTIDSDNSTYINVTGYRDVKYLDRKVRFALRYHLKENDTKLTIQPYMKNIGTLNIPLEMGFTWHMRDIKINMTEENNMITVASYNPKDLHNLNIEVSNINDGALFITQNDTGEHIFLAWDESIPHIIKVQEAIGQYNSPVTLGLKVGTLAVGQEKSTTFYWADALVYCEQQGDDDWDLICFFQNPYYTSPSYSNFSDGDNPKFKITVAQGLPFGCTIEYCRLKYQYGAGSSWTQVYQGSGYRNCYNVNLGERFIQHSRTADNLTSWRVEVDYTGSEYCFGLGGVGDYRYNMSSNEHTPLNENVTIVEENSTEYQEDADVTLDGGGWYVAFPFSYLIDGTWGGTPAAGIGGVAYGYMNYTKPCNAFGVNWQVQDAAGTFNLTVPNECFNQDVLQFQAVSNGLLGDAFWNCWNGTDYHNLRSYLSSQVMYEEAVNWNVTNLVADYDINQGGDPDNELLTLFNWTFDGVENVSYRNESYIPDCWGCDLNISVDVQTWDDSYFSPTGNEAWVASNNTFFEACEVIIEKVRESYWMFAVILTLVGAILVMFALCKMTDNWMMKIPCYVSQVLLLVITIHFSFVALTAYENTILINGIMQTLYAIVLKGLVIPMYIILVIYLIHDSVNKMRHKDLNKF